MTTPGQKYYEAHILPNDVDRKHWDDLDNNIKNVWEGGAALSALAARSSQAITTDKLYAPEFSLQDQMNNVWRRVNNMSEKMDMLEAYIKESKQKLPEQQIIEEVKETLAEDNFDFRLFAVGLAHTVLTYIHTGMQIDNQTVKFIRENAKQIVAEHHKQRPAACANPS
jgi:hypothetical protein